MVRFRLAVLTAAMLFAFAAAADDAALNSAPRTIDVVVTDNRGAHLSGLTQSDFTILENGQPRGIATSCIATTTQSADYSYFNYYNLTVSTAGLVDLSVSSEDFIPTLYLLDEGGNLLAVDSGGASASRLSQYSRAFLASGLFIVPPFATVAA